MARASAVRGASRVYAGECSLPHAYPRVNCRSVLLALLILALERNLTVSGSCVTSQDVLIGICVATLVGLRPRSARPPMRRLLQTVRLTKKGSGRRQRRPFSGKQQIFVPKQTLVIHNVHSTQVRAPKEQNVYY